MFSVAFLQVGQPDRCVSTSGCRVKSNSPLRYAPNTRLTSSHFIRCLRNSLVSELPLKTSAPSADCVLSNSRQPHLVFSREVLCTAANTSGANGGHSGGANARDPMRHPGEVGNTLQFFNPGILRPLISKLNIGRIYSQSRAVSLRAGINRSTLCYYSEAGGGCCARNDVCYPHQWEFTHECYEIFG